MARAEERKEAVRNHKISDTYKTHKFCKAIILWWVIVQTVVQNLKRVGRIAQQMCERSKNVSHSSLTFSLDAIKQV